MLSEDERYRTSTQFRFWSYTPAALHAIRSNTNQNAAERVREAVKRVREKRAISSSEGDDSRANSVVPDTEVDCLTVEEELTLVAHACRQLMGLFDHIKDNTAHRKFPFKVKYTAIQYIKRFYLSNSVMTYNPADIIKVALYFATKVENYYYKLDRFAEDIPGNKTTSPEEILALEFLLTQGLRFQFDVRHPHRALDGAIMDMRAMLEKNIPAIPGGAPTTLKPADTETPLEKRVLAASQSAEKYLSDNALISDVYFYFTPSQIMLAALMLADPGLTEWYIATKFPPSGTGQDLMHKIHGTILRCAQMMLEIVQIPVPNKELRQKLTRCRNPEKMDLVALQKAKREGDAGADDRALKKRKLERQKSAKEGDDLFGPSLKAS